ncbi:MAG: carboxypeptidase regulatory-like domain-containing protein [Candidatus Micrarchaeota archaeon]|nr:carboxypeptidase regulatory-like domain-containing protein [Candidatus Micrarchaeota archaeon]
MNIGYGHFCLTIYANDTAGQVNSTTVCFITAGAADAASSAPPELLPMSIFVDSVRCSSDGTGAITVQAWDYQDKPLSGVLIKISGKSGTTGSDGTVTLRGFEQGDYSISASKDGYTSTGYEITVSCQKKEITPPPQQPGAETLSILSVIVQEMTYNNDGTADVKLLVQDSDNNSVPGATVRVSGSDIIYTTGNDGTVTVRSNPTGDYTATASKKGYNEDTADFTIKFQAKPEAAQLPAEQPAITEQGQAIPYLNLCVPALIIAAILAIIFFLWKRRKKEEEPKKPESGKAQPANPQAPKPMDLPPGKP